MAQEKTRSEIIENILDKENQVPSKLNIPPDTKYKKQRNSDPNKLPDLKVSENVVVRVNKSCKWGNSDVDGYLLCKILDFDIDDSFWCINTEVIVFVVKVSQPHMLDQIGRLYSVTYNKQSIFCGKRFIISFDKNFVKWVGGDPH